MTVYTSQKIAILELQISNISPEERKAFGDRLKVFKKLNGWCENDLAKWQGWGGLFQLRSFGSPADQAYLSGKQMSRILNGQKVGLRTFLYVCLAFGIADISAFLLMDEKSFLRFIDPFVREAWGRQLSQKGRGDENQCLQYQVG